MNSIQSDSWLLTYDNLVLKKFDMVEWIIFMCKYINKKDLLHFLITHNEKSTFMFLQLSYTCIKYDNSSMNLYKYKDVIPRLDQCEDYKCLLDYCTDEENYYTDINEIDEIMNNKKMESVDEIEEEEDSKSIDNSSTELDNKINLNNNDKSDNSCFKRNKIWFYGPKQFDKIKILREAFGNNCYFKKFDDDWSGYNRQKNVFVSLPSVFNKNNNQYINKWCSDEIFENSDDDDDELDYDTFIVVCDCDIDEYCKGNQKLNQAWKSKFDCVKIKDLSDSEVIKLIFLNYEKFKKSYK